MELAHNSTPQMPKCFSFWLLGDV